MLFNLQIAIAADAPVIIGGVEMPQVETSPAFEQIKKKSICLYRTVVMTHSRGGGIIRLSFIFIGIVKMVFIYYRLIG